MFTYCYLFISVLYTRDNDKMFSEIQRRRVPYTRDNNKMFSEIQRPRQKVLSYIALQPDVIDVNVDQSLNTSRFAKTRFYRRTINHWSVQNSTEFGNKIEEHDWTLVSRGVFVYSAYLDTRWRPVKVQIISVVDLWKGVAPKYCQVWFKGQMKPYVSDIVSEIVPETHNKRRVCHMVSNMEMINALKNRCRRGQ